MTIFYDYTETNFGIHRFRGKGFNYQSFVTQLDPFASKLTTYSLIVSLHTYELVYIYQDSASFSVIHNYYSYALGGIGVQVVGVILGGLGDTMWERNSGYN